MSNCFLPLVDVFFSRSKATSWSPFDALFLWRPPHAFSSLSLDPPTTSLSVLVEGCRRRRRLIRGAAIDAHRALPPPPVKKARREFKPLRQGARQTTFCLMLLFANEADTSNKQQARGTKKKATTTTTTLVCIYNEILLERGLVRACLWTREAANTGEEEGCQKGGPQKGDSFFMRSVKILCPVSLTRQHPAITSSQSPFYCIVFRLA